MRARIPGFLCGFWSPNPLLPIRRIVVLGRLAPVVRRGLSLSPSSDACVVQLAAKHAATQRRAGKRMECGGQQSAIGAPHPSHLARLPMRTSTTAVLNCVEGSRGRDEGYEGGREGEAHMKPSKIDQSVVWMMISGLHLRWGGQRAWPATDVSSRQTHRHERQARL